MSVEDRKQPGTDEVVSLNADNLDAKQLDELNQDELDSVAGGTLDSCNINCGTYSAN